MAEEHKSFIGVARAKVEVNLRKISGMSHIDADVDFHAAGLVNASGKFTGRYEGVQYDAAAECFHRTILWNNRNNYLVKTGVQETEQPLYYDSDPIIERGWRTFRPIPRPWQEGGGGPLPPGRAADPFMGTEQLNLNDVTYPVDYEGPRWGYAKIATSSNNANNAQSQNISERQWIQQTKSKAGLEWAIRQEYSCFYNQAFWISFRKGIAIDPVEPTQPTPTPGSPPQPPRVRQAVEAVNPTTGSYLMICLGGGYSRNTGENSWTIVFPIGGSPFIMDTQAYWDGINGTTQTPINPYNDIAQQVIDQATRGKNTDESWILTNDISEFTLTFMIIRNRLFIRSSFSSKPWIFPDRNADPSPADLGAAGLMLQYQGDRARSATLGFAMKNMPVEIHGRGFTCAMNFNPMEFQQDNAYIVLPPIFHSTDQTINYWHRNASSFLEVPSGDINIKAYGYDRNQLNAVGNIRDVTTMGLPPECVQCVQLYDDTIAQGSKFELGPGTVVKANSPLAAKTNHTRYAIVFYSTKSLYAPTVSSAYATPFWYRFKARAEIQPNTEPNDVRDISAHVIQISHSATNMNRILIQREFQVTCWIPKDNDMNKEGLLMERQALTGHSWARYAKNPMHIRIWMGLEGPGVNENCAFPQNPTAQNCYFTGISFGGDINLSANRDTITLNCKDYMSILEDTFYMASPYFDGMSVPYAIAYVLERGGVAALKSLNGGASAFKIGENARNLNPNVYERVLQDSNRFLQPLVKFNQGTKLMECIRSFVEKFWLVFRNDNEGAFVLDAMSGGDPGTARFAETNDIEPVATFQTYVVNPDDYHKLIYDKKTIMPKVREWYNVLVIRTVDRFSGSLHQVSDGDPESLDDPNSPNFIGYMRVQFSDKSALGGRQEAAQLLALWKNIITKPRTWVAIQINGHHNLKPLDIIKVDNNNYRIMDIRGNMTPAPASKWIMNITAEHIGTYKPDVDTSKFQPPTA